MSVPKKLSDKLKEKEINHQVVNHKKVYTALDAAATLKVKLGEVIKTLLVKVGKDYYLALLSADKNLDLKKLAKDLNVSSTKVSIPKEKVMSERFKVKPGAISAFGSIHKIPVVLDKNLTRLKEGIFSSGSFTESIKMKVKDYLTLENPVVGSFSVAKKVKIQPAYRQGRKAKGKGKPKVKKKSVKTKRRKK